MDRTEAARLISLLDQPHGVAIEVGAADGEFTSLTRPLEEIGWDVVCVEPNPIYAAKARLVRKRVVEAACADFYADNYPFTICNIDHDCRLHEMQGGSSLDVKHEHLERLGWKPKGMREIHVKVRRLDEIMHAENLTQLDFLSIDTEGTEDAVLLGLNITRYWPKIIVAENWPGINKTDHILLPLGYRHIPRVSGNYTDWYMR